VIELIGDSPCIKGIRVCRIFMWEMRGESMRDLEKMYPSLTKGEILDALTFAAKNPALMKAEIAKEHMAVRL
jgi:uncharacterized protein (DUF433 family)